MSRLEQILTAESLEPDKSDRLQIFDEKTMPNGATLRVYEDDDRQKYVVLRDVARCLDQPSIEPDTSAIIQIAKRNNVKFDSRRVNGRVTTVLKIEMLEFWVSKIAEEGTPKLIQAAEKLLEGQKTFIDTIMVGEPQMENIKTLEEIHAENAENYAKGARGEEVVKRLLEREGYVVTKPDDSPANGASLVDFEVTDSYANYSYFVEVKVRSNPFLFAHGRFECYTFPKSQIDTYLEYAKKHSTWVDLYVLNPVSKKVYFGSIADDLMENFKYEDKVFPFLIPSDENGGQNYVFCEAQFAELSNLTDEECAYINGEIDSLDDPEGDSEVDDAAEDTASDAETTAPPENQPPLEEPVEEQEKERLNVNDTEKEDLLLTLENAVDAIKDYQKALKVPAKDIEAIKNINADAVDLLKAQLYICEGVVRDKVRFLYEKLFDVAMSENK